MVHELSRADEVQLGDLIFHNIDVGPIPEAAEKEKAMDICPNKPILLKLSPDMESETLTMALTESMPYVDGWILTNTTSMLGNLELSLPANK